MDCPLGGELLSWFCDGEGPEWSPGGDPGLGAGLFTGLSLSGDGLELLGLRTGNGFGFWLLKGGLTGAETGTGGL